MTYIIVRFNEKNNPKPTKVTHNPILEIVWTVIPAIILIAIGEIRNSEKDKIIIILNDYIEISKSFVNLQETKFINAILDKLIYEEK